VALSSLLKEVAIPSAICSSEKGAPRANTMRSPVKSGDCVKRIMISPASVRVLVWRSKNGGYFEILSSIGEVFEKSTGE